MADKQSSAFALLLPVYVPAILVSFAEGFVVPILPIFIDSFGVSSFVLGLVLAASGFGMMFSEIPAGRLLERISPKWAMTAAGIMIAASAGIIALEPGIVAVSLLLVLKGAGVALWGLSRHVYITSVTQIGNRGRATAIFGGLTRIGFFLGPLVGGILAQRFGFTAPFVGLAAVAFVGVLVVFVFVPAIEARTVTTRVATKEQMRQARPALLRAGIPQALIQTIRQGRNVLLPLIASLVLGLDLETTGLVVALAGFVDMALFPLSGWIMDRFGRKFAIVPSLVLQSIGMVLLLFVSNSTELMAVAVLLGIGNGMSAGTMMTLGADLAPPGAVAVFLSYWRLIGDAGGTLAPVLVGSAAQFIGMSGSAGAVAAAGAVGAVWFAFYVPETLQRVRRIRTSRTS